MSTSAANALTLTSPDIKPGGKIADEQVFNGADCTGKNVSPALAWTGAPKGTKSFAVSMFDPDAPTAAASGTGGSPICRRMRPACRRAPAAERVCRRARCSPATISARPATAARARRQGKPHHYHITVYALDLDKLPIDANASPAVFGFDANAHTLAKATLTGLYGR